ncbi:hypothetical protein FCM35_KLT20809 [Carex littledalei]|uniref:Uncharacterized protein n=1 Tax=Carex littledalei TaxID=544730 RepID=A0A833QU37_9POAL|nr:hypothetical protein FCM35_KLT20809 [Carex littledalei]
MEGEATRPNTTATIRNHFSRMNGWNRYSHHYLGRRLTRTGVFLAFLIFSPLILPLFCVCFPFVCFVAVLLHLVLIKWRFQLGVRDRDKAGSIARCKEAVGSAEVRAGLLERYLEDQLGLVVDACFG